MDHNNKMISGGSIRWFTAIYIFSSVCRLRWTDAAVFNSSIFHVFFFYLSKSVESSVIQPSRYHLCSICKKKIIPKYTVEFGQFSSLAFGKITLIWFIFFHRFLEDVERGNRMRNQYGCVTADGSRELLSSEIGDVSR